MILSHNAVDMAVKFVAIAAALGVVAGAGRSDDATASQKITAARSHQQQHIRGHHIHRLEQSRMLGGNNVDNGELMFVMRPSTSDDDLGDPHTNYCLAYEVTGWIKSPDKPDVEILGLRTRPCDVNDREQQWIISSPSKSHTRIESRRKSGMCITNLVGGSGYRSAQLKECGEFDDQKVSVPGDGTDPGAAAAGPIATEAGRALSPQWFNCESESHSLEFAIAAESLRTNWDVVKPKDYRDPPKPDRPSLDGDERRVIITSEHDPSTCVASTPDLELKDCNKKDETLVWYYSEDDDVLWSPTSRQLVYGYNANKGIFRGGCCLSYSSGWYDGEPFGPLFAFNDRCESGELRSGFILVPVEQYEEGTPQAPDDIKPEDYVQLRLTSSDSSEPLCLRAIDRGTEVDLVECRDEKYEVDDEELFFLDGDDIEAGGMFKIRSKKDLTLCLDLEDKVSPYRGDQRGLIPRMGRCDDYSNRQSWRYNKKGFSEISNGFWKEEHGLLCVGEKDTEWTILKKGCTESQAAKIGWTIIPNDVCSRDEEDRVTYPKRDYFLFVSRNDPDRCWERDVTENMGLLLNGYCHMTIPRRFNSQIFYFEDVGGNNEGAVRIKYRSDESVCMAVQDDNMAKNSCIDMFQECDEDNLNQEWTYDQNSGEISPVSKPGLCISSSCRDRCTFGENYECSGGNDCGDFCLRKCNGESDQGFDTTSVKDYRMQRDYGKGIDRDDVIMIVLREDPEYCIKAYDSLELQDMVVSTCKIDNAEEHFTFEREEQGMRWRSVENPHIFIEPEQNKAGKKLITNEDMISKNKQHWQLKNDGTIRPAAKDGLCVTRNVCKLNSSPEKNDNVELIECDADGPKIIRRFDLVHPSKYVAYLKQMNIEYGK